MASPTDIVESIDPGTIEQGERGGLEDQMRQVLAQQTAGTAPPPPGATASLAQQSLQTRPTSDSPVTAGLPLGPGPGPRPSFTEAPEVEHYRVIAQHARNPMLKAYARNALRAATTRAMNGG
jgi:hypothetical protein